MWSVEETSEDQERASRKLTLLNSKGLWLKNLEKMSRNRGSNFLLQFKASIEPLTFKEGSKWTLR